MTYIKVYLEITSMISEYNCSKFNQCHIWENKVLKKPAQFLFGGLD